MNWLRVAGVGFVAAAAIAGIYAAVFGIILACVYFLGPVYGLVVVFAAACVYGGIRLAIELEREP